MLNIANKITILLFPENISTSYANVLKDTADKNIKQNFLLCVCPYVLCYSVTGSYLEFWTKHILEIVQ